MKDVPQQRRYRIPGHKDLDGTDINELVWVREQHQTINKEGHNLFKSLQVKGVPTIIGLFKQKPG